MSNYSILVVDDEPSNFEVIEALLSITGYVLHYINRGQDAISALDKLNPDVILLDVMMPGIDGIEVCRQIKAMPKWQAVPIIMVTALTGAKDLARCLEAGADDFVGKPINGVELRARVQSMLRIKKQHDRIQSLSKLQRNNIHSLENSLNELRLDLAVSFPTELNTPLNTILANIGRLKQNMHEMTTSEVSDTLEIVNKSTIELSKLNQDFLFYLQLSLPEKDAKKYETCDARTTIEQLTIRRTAQLKTSTRLNLNIEDAELAVAGEDLKYIVDEFLTRILKISEAEVFINVYGRIMDGAFHFYIDNRQANAISRDNSKLSELIQFNSGMNPGQELSIGLKIAKKMIETYEGLFLITAADAVADGQGETTIYITLPLVVVSSLPTVSTNLPVG
jgi:two-component system, sensor histidine kinase and response regulator